MTDLRASGGQLGACYHGSPLGVMGLSSLWRFPLIDLHDSPKDFVDGLTELPGKALKPYGTLTESRFSDATYFTAAVRSSLSQANLRPSRARFNVLNRTTENSWR